MKRIKLLEPSKAVCYKLEDGTTVFDGRTSELCIEEGKWGYEELV